MQETVTIKNCSACSGDHPGLAFRQLANPVGQFDHAATCPSTGKEVMFRELTPEEEANRAPGHGR